MYWKNRFSNANHKFSTTLTRMNVWNRKLLRLKNKIQQMRPKIWLLN